MIQRPAAEALQQARVALQGRVSAERRDETMLAIAKDVQKYIDEATPLVRESAKKDIGSTVIPILVKEFSANELTELIGILESPTKKKFIKPGESREAKPVLVAPPPPLSAMASTRRPSMKSNYRPLRSDCSPRCWKVRNSAWAWPSMTATN